MLEYLAAKVRKVNTLWECVLVGGGGFLRPPCDNMIS